ncbi:MAG: hypothetical protein DWI02_05855, partial [Planctomycetota bacterium]
MHAISWEFFNFRHHRAVSTSATETKNFTTPVTTCRRDWGFLLTENRTGKSMVFGHRLRFHREGFLVDRRRVLHRL